MKNINLKSNYYKLIVMDNAHTLQKFFYPAVKLQSKYICLNKVFN